MNSIIAQVNADKTVSLIGKQGTTWELPLTLKNPDGSFLNLTGYAFMGQLRATYEISEKTDFVCTIANAGEGKVVISLSNTATADIPSYKDSIDKAKLKSYNGIGVYVYDIEMVDAQNKVSRILEGKLYVDPEVTK